MKPIEIRDGARRDLRAAVVWYRKKDRSLPERFLAALTAAVDQIEMQPDVGLPVARGARSLKVKRFPFRLIFREEPNLIVIFAVAHDRRRPGYWLRRIAQD